tara:strand:+ start:15087 stop:15638 length:552 start_codon:yes stop_codon:yes gene_type:complete
MPGSTKKYPSRYVPKQLTKKDKKKQAREIEKSKKMYKNKKYHTRKKIDSFKNKQSPHITKAQEIYKVDVIKPSKELSEKTKCSKKGLDKIFRKGQGAYFSSGSRPNQTPHSWAYARLASAITGGKAAAVDYKIIKEECSKNSKVVKLAEKSMKKYKKGRKKVPKTSVNISYKKKRKNKTKNKK